MPQNGHYLPFVCTLSGTFECRLYSATRRLTCAVTAGLRRGFNPGPYDLRLSRPLAVCFSLAFLVYVRFLTLEAHWLWT
jgi:hypothetical protein